MNSQWDVKSILHGTRSSDLQEHCSAEGRPDTDTTAEKHACKHIMHGPRVEAFHAVLPAQPASAAGSFLAKQP